MKKLILSVFLILLYVFVTTNCERKKNPTEPNNDTPEVEPVKIVEEGDSPAWSPDGKQIAYIAYVNGSHNLFLTSDTGGFSTQLTDMNSSCTWTPSWSPDGTKIAFTAIIRDTPGVAKVYYVSANGGDITQLTPDSLHVQGCDWSPDGTHIVFDAPAGSGLSRGISLWTYRISDGKITLLTPGSIYDGWPKYSPDGSIIVYESMRVSSGPIQIWTVAADGSNPKQITEKEGGYPCWSSDGKWIAYIVDQSEDINVWNNDLWIVPSNGGEAVQLTKSSLQERRPAWSPDGKKIAFDSNVGGSEHGIWILPVSVPE